MQTFKKLFFLLSSYERKRLGLLLILVIIMAFIDMVGVASILPFVAVLTNPSLIDTNIILNKMFKAANTFGVKNNQEFLLTLGFAVFTLLIISLIFKAVTTYVQLRFVQMREYSIGKRLVEGYLYQPYNWFLSRHSADLGKTILSEVGQLTGGGIAPLIELISKGILSLALITLLIIANPELALIVSLSLGSAYLITFYFVKKKLNNIGKEKLINNRLRFTVVSEAFGATREVKVGGLEEIYIKNFSNYAQIYARTNASSQVIAQLPRYILEAIAFGGILLLLLYMISQTGSFNNSLPVFSLYILAGYRLIPALQGIYVSFTGLAFIGPSLDKIYDDLKNLKADNRQQNRGALSFEKLISLKNINYSYPNATQKVIKDISLSISKNSTVGFIGSTGSGKTTIVDIILGLLRAQKGTLEVDGKIITEQNLRVWQRSIGYVSQHIYLSDDTIAANIAFGVDPKHINKNIVEKVAKIANAHNFIVNELPSKYQTIIGERGARLSGGQRQRIGIARALYHNPKVLILDEATSALDNQTGKAVIDAINNLKKEITIIIITHQLSALKNCDKIFLLEKGELKNSGTFEELIQVDESYWTSTAKNMQ
jgi:ABC-type multidrug transport system fused ATPase/permease subunit